MTSLRPLKFSCPFCRRVYARSLSRVRLGPGIRRCRRCGRIFTDGSIEWPEADPKQRREYLFPERGVIYVIGEVAIGVVLALLERKSWTECLALAVWLAAVGLLLLSFRLIYCRFKIRQSNFRYQKKLLETMGYGVAATAEAWPK